MRDEDNDELVVGVTRIEAFSVGVSAMAIRRLVLVISVPNLDERFAATIRAAAHCSTDAMPTVRGGAPAHQADSVAIGRAQSGGFGIGDSEGSDTARDAAGPRN